MNVDFLTPKARVSTRADGRVALAAARILAGETVAAFGGRCVTRDELTSPADAAQIDEDLFLTNVDREARGHVIGHSCAPNCGITGGVLVVAMRDIAEGETLTFDRAMLIGCDIDDLPCACGAPACRRTVTGRDWMMPELQVAYRGYFSPYLAKRIANLVRTGAERRAFSY